MIEQGGRQARNFIVDKALTLNLTHMVLEELQDSFGHGKVKMIGQY